jgi:hypothetical protein
MKSENSPRRRFDVMLAGLGWVLLVYNLFSGPNILVVHAYNHLLDILFPIAYAGIVATFLFHIPALAFLIRTFRKTDRLTRKHWAIVIMGVLSAMAPPLEWASLGDIYDNIQNGLPGFLDDSGIYLAAVVHIAFISIVLQQISKTGRREMETDDLGRRIDDTIFRIVHSVGVISGGFGFLFCCLQAFLSISAQIRPFLAGFYSCAFLIPYGIVLLLWKMSLRKAQKQIDEKQRADISMGSFAALWSVLGIGLAIYITGFFVPGFSERIQWYPCIFFSGLGVFSLLVFLRSWEE